MIGTGHNTPSDSVLWMTAVELKTAGVRFRANGLVAKPSQVSDVDVRFGSHHA